jgi:DNA-binding MarR family transcriptional regulator
MNPTTPNHYRLTTKQQAILNLLYRFRFATSEQLSQALNITKTTTNKRLKLMLELKYIGRRYEPEDRLLRKHAAYYLSPDGINELKRISKQKYLPNVLRNIRHDEAASESFAEHCLAVFDLYGMLRAKYGEELQFFTKTQMAAASYFPKKLPDAHIQLGAEKPKLFLLDLLHESQPFFLATRAVMRYITYTDDNDWPRQHEFPNILLVCDSASLQKRLSKKMQRKLEDIDDPKLQISIVSLGSLRTSETQLHRL